MRGFMWQWNHTCLLWVKCLSVTFSLMIQVDIIRVQLGLAEFLYHNNGIKSLKISTAIFNLWKLLFWLVLHLSGQGFTHSFLTIAGLLFCSMDVLELLHFEPVYNVAADILPSCCSKTFYTSFYCCCGAEDWTVNMGVIMVYYTFYLFCYC